VKGITGMVRQVIAWPLRHWMLTASILLLLAVVLLNVVAYNHAYRMTHFVHAGERTKKPEQLALWEKLGVLFWGITLPRPALDASPTNVGLAFETVRIPSTDGIMLEGWYIAHPQPRGAAAIFHGYTTHKAVLLGEARGLYDLGYSVLLVDFRGSGGSTGMVTTTGVREAGDVAASFRYLKEREPHLPIILYGQSMGAASVLRAVARDQIEPSAIVVECPFDRLLTTAKNRFHSMGIPSFPFAQLLVFWGGVQHGYNGFRHNPIDYAAAVRCPVLFLSGDRDPRVTPQQAESIYDRLAGPKRFVLFSEVGHESCCNARPAEWQKAVGEFLAEYARPQP